MPQFCAEMDGLVALENVVVMLTCNRPDYIDPAILRPERIDRKVKIRRPDKHSGAADFRDLSAQRLAAIRPICSRNTTATSKKRAQALVDHAMDKVFRKAPETEFVEVYTRSGGVETLYYKDLLSGALIISVVERAKDFAIKRSIDVKSIQRRHQPRRYVARHRHRVQGKRNFPENRHPRRLAQTARLRAGKRGDDQADSSRRARKTHRAAA